MANEAFETWLVQCCSFQVRQLWSQIGTRESQKALTASKQRWMIGRKGKDAFVGASKFDKHNFSTIVACLYLIISSGKDPKFDHFS